MCILFEFFDRETHTISRKREIIVKITEKLSIRQKSKKVYIKTTDYALVENEALTIQNSI
jgi:hypothetical protein